LNPSVTLHLHKIDLGNVILLIGRILFSTMEPYSEDVQVLNHQFPMALAWGKSSSPGGEGVTATVVHSKESLADLSNCRR
jgi:hypothetical protein